MDSNKRKYYNIFTGKEVNNYYEALGFEYYFDNNKKIYTKLNNEEKVFDYKTNTEFCFNDLKFIICRYKNGELAIFFNVIMDNNLEKRYRSFSFEEMKDYHSEYSLDEKGDNFKWLNNYFYIKIK